MLPATDARKPGKINASPPRPASMTLQRFLTRLIWLCVLPLLVIAAVLAVISLHSLQTLRDEQSQALARNLATAIDNRLLANIAALATISRSPLLEDPARWKDFYQVAQSFREHLGSHVALVDPREPARMVFTTRLPFDAQMPPLPPSATLSAMAAAQATGRPAVGNLFQGPVKGEPLIAVAVPVPGHSAKRLMLIATDEAASLQRRLEKVALPEGWALSLLDGAGGVIARRAPPGMTRTDVDERGRVVVGLTASPWSVVLEIPRAAYWEPIAWTTLAVGLGVAAAALISLLGGHHAGRRLARAVASLTARSTEGANNAGRTLTPDIEEISAARRRIEQAAALEDSNQRLEQRVTARTAELADARNRIAAYATEQEARIEQERRRVAREVHDQLGQVFTALKLIVQSIPGSAYPPGQQTAMHQALELGIASARRITAELRPPLLDDFGLSAALEHLARETLASARLGMHVDVRVDLRDQERLSPAQALALFRISQEAVTNVIRHARATRMSFTGQADGPRYLFAFEDDGQGFDLRQVRAGAMGLASMRERASLFGGRFETDAQPGGGTRSRVTLPLGEVAES